MLVSARADTWASVRCGDQPPVSSALCVGESRRVRGRFRASRVDGLLLRTHSGLRLGPASSVSVVTHYGPPVSTGFPVVSPCGRLQTAPGSLGSHTGVTRAADLKPSAAGGKLWEGFREVGEAGK